MLSSKKEAIWEEEPFTFGLNCEYFLDDTNRTSLRVQEEETPLEKSRIYGPFPAEVVHWLMVISQRNSSSKVSAAFTLSHDVEGREYLEY